MAEPVTLRAITDHNRAAVLSLRVTAGQRDFVESVARSLREGSPLGFYVRYGFVDTGEMFDHERVLRLAL